MCVVPEVVWCTSFFIRDAPKNSLVRVRFRTRRYSKPAHAHELNYFSTLCTGRGRRGEYVLEFCDHTKFLRSCGGVSGKGNDGRC